MKHYSVMLNEVIDALNIKSDGIYVDATLGYAGMSKEILKRVNNGLLIAIDQDEEAIKYSTNILKSVGNNYKIVKDNFVNLKKILEDLKITKVDGIIFDLGFSSPQIDEDNRGFSFMKDAPLDMRMNLDNKLTARGIVNTYKEDELEKIFFKYGEEKLSKNICKEIVKSRKVKKLETTIELVEIIKKSVGAKYFYKEHPERKIFQALRIEVNKELDVLEKVLPDAIDVLNKDGRLAVITFHSLEDKIVKRIFKENSDVDEIVKGLPDIPSNYLPKIKLINKKPILPSDEEIKENSRSHSAKLRIVERI